jgi:hypothetical protein
MFVGQRVADKDGARGTVRYVGPVATSKTADAVYAGAGRRCGATSQRLFCVLCAFAFARSLALPWRCCVSSVFVAAGIEWDDATRGKHDGAVVDGAGASVRYFTCAPAAGSFLKVNLLQTGVSFVTAMRTKYEDVDAASGGTFELHDGRALEVELVGDDKIRCVRCPPCCRR